MSQRRSAPGLLPGLFLAASFTMVSWPACSAEMTPIEVTGFNRDVVIEKTAAGPPYYSWAEEMNPGEGSVFYQQGLPGTGAGLPDSGAFTSVNDGTTRFQFQPYTASNALVMSFQTGTSSGTLKLTQPARYERISFIAHSASGGGFPTCTLNFADGSSHSSSYNALDWFYNEGYALAGTERIYLGNGRTEGWPDNPRFYQTTLDLVGLGLSTRQIESITFNQADGTGATAVYALSGERGADLPATIATEPADVTVTEIEPAEFVTKVSGSPEPRVQWFRNGAAIPEGTNASFRIPEALLTDHGAEFKLVASNFVNGVAHYATSRVAILSVNADVTAPVFISATSLSTSELRLSFSEKLALEQAGNLANYTLAVSNSPAALLGATLDTSGTNVLLTFNAVPEGTRLTVTARDLTDRAAAKNKITPLQTSVEILAYSPAAIGSPTPIGSVRSTAEGYQVTGGGSGIFSTADQFQLAYQEQAGDFDVQVRLDSLTGPDAWSEAGLMARLDLSPGAPFAAVLATPSVSGVSFRSRTSANLSAQMSGHFPVNYPQTWLRLRRVGSLITGYASFDGLTWSQLGSVSLPASTVYLGFAVSSRNATEPAVAIFRNVGRTISTVVQPAPALERLGQSSRLTSLVISEIMYHPADSPAFADPDRNLEFIEVFNSRGEPEDISGYRIDGSVSYVFPAGTIIPGGGFLVVARAPSSLKSAYGLPSVLGPWDNSDSQNLPNSAGTVQLRHRTGAIFLEVAYEDSDPWPVAADGAGHSLVLAKPSYGERDPRAWDLSAQVGGSPGEWNGVAFDPLDAVRINEFLANSDAGLEDFIELRNTSPQAVDLSGAWLTDRPETNRFRIPDGTVLSPGAYISFTQGVLGFGLDATGGRIFLVNSNQNRVCQAIVYGAQESGVSSGVTLGGTGFYPLVSMSPGTSNAPPRMPEVVINELLFHPASENDDDQFIEIHNRADKSLSLANWRLEGGVDYIFPAASSIPANGYVVVARNSARLQTNYPHLNAANCFGNFSGRLSHGGERIVLSKPVTNYSVVNGQTIATLAQVVVNEVTYVDSGRHSRWADGGGSSLELLHPDADNRHMANWADSDETRKAPWTSISTTGRLDFGNVTPDQLQVLLQGAGECLIDDVRVTDNQGVNRIRNSTFESGASSWTAEGTQSPSGWESSEGYNSSGSYHIRAIDRADNQVNRVRTSLSTALTPNTSGVTISAKVRWLKGAPDIVLRLRGNWLECAASMTLPTNPGTPGLANSRLVTNAPPAFLEVAHSPVLPQPGEPIRLTARVADSDGLGAVTLGYRVDPIVSYEAVTMVDDGKSGDSTAGDGVYTAVIPAQFSPVTIAYVVAAVDAATNVAAALFPPTVPEQECLVRVGETEPAGNLPVYRIWMTQATHQRWATRNKLDNTPLPITFVLGNQRVIQNAEALYAGSPYIAPGYCGPACGRCGYSLSMPADDRFLGDRALVLDWPGGHGGESTAIQEQMGWWIADQLNVAYSHRYHIRLHVDGITDEDRRTIFEAVIQPAGRFVEAWSPEAPDGDLFKIDRAFEFSNGGDLIADPQPRLQNYVTVGGAKKTERYRWTFLYRSTDRTRDYSNIFSLVDALNATAPEPYTTATYDLVDVEQWMRIFAIEQMIVNFDAYGHEIGKNMYAYLPENGKWKLYMFDLDWLMLAAAQSGRGPSNAGLFNADDPTIERMYAHPPFRRAFFRAVKDALAGPFDAANYGPVMDAKYRSLVANGVNWCDGSRLTAPTAVKAWFAARRTYLENQVRSESPFTIVSASISNNVAVLVGTAPFAVAELDINGARRPLRWLDMSAWTTTATLRHGTNVLTVSGLRPDASPVPNATATVTVVYEGPDPAPLATVSINEWMADNKTVLPDPVDEVHSDWLELYNYGDAPVDLAGFHLTDSATDQARFTIPDNGHQVIPAKGFLLVWADGEEAQNSAGLPDLHLPFRLGKDGEFIGLYTPAGELVDSVTFGSQTTDVSEGRYPDGATNVVTLSTPTPRLANAAPPSPVLQVNVTASGMTLSFAGVPNVSYVLEQTDNLSGVSWTAVGDSVQSNGGQITMPLPTGNAPALFFRIRPYYP